MKSGRGLEEFVTIVDEGSVTAAAERLELPRPTVGRRLVLLEERLNVKLVHRTTRRLKLTRQGELLYERARSLVRGIREAEAEVMRLDDVPRGRLRVSLPIRMPYALVSGWMAELLETYPELRLELVATSMHVDLVADGFDVAVRVGEVEDPSLICRSLPAAGEILVASRAYLEKAGRPQTVAELANHACIIGHRGRGIPSRKWPLLDGGAIEVTEVLCTNESGLRVACVKQGMGIALLSRYLVQRELDSGELEQLFPGVIGRTETISLVYVAREFLDPKIRAFVDFFADALAAARGTSKG